MDIHINSLAKKIGCSLSTLNAYISRSEYSHIKINKGICYGVTKEDIENLIQFYYTKLKASKPQLITTKLEKTFNNIIQKKKAKILKQIERYLDII